jgi:hypothetical protein
MQVRRQVHPQQRTWSHRLLMAHKARCLKDEPGTLQFAVMVPRKDNAKVQELIASTRRDVNGGDDASLGMSAPASRYALRVSNRNRHREGRASSRHKVWINVCGWPRHRPRIDIGGAIIAAARITARSGPVAIVPAIPIPCSSKRIIVGHKPTTGTLCAVARRALQQGARQSGAEAAKMLAMCHKRSWPISCRSVVASHKPKVALYGNPDLMQASRRDGAIGAVSIA